MVNLTEFKPTLFLAEKVSAFCRREGAVGLKDPAGVTRTCYLCFTSVVCMRIIASGAGLLIFPALLRRW